LAQLEHSLLQKRDTNTTRPAKAGQGRKRKSTHALSNQVRPMLCNSLILPRAEQVHFIPVGIKLCQDFFGGFKCFSDLTHAFCPQGASVLTKALPDQVRDVLVVPSWANAWLGVSLLALADSLESISFFAYKVESFLFILYKFFVIYEEQLNQKNYNIAF
jgi:hypothetical protein